MSSLDLASVESSLLRYEDAFAKKIDSKKPKIAAELVKIDRWLRNKLPEAIRMREPPSITQQELRCAVCPYTCNQFTDGCSFVWIPEVYLLL